MPEQVTILGDGAMATVCAILLTQGGHRVTMWGTRAASIDHLLADREQTRLLPGVRIPAEVTLTTDEATALDGATLIISAIPTQYSRAVWERIKAHVAPDVRIVSVAKGIENETLLRPTQIIGAVLGGEHAVRSSRLCALSGPNIAGELARRLPGTAVAASTDEALARRVQAAFSTEWFRVYTNRDTVGVELAGATKNVIAIAAGILDGLGAGDNAKAALVTRGLVEITRLGVAMGADALTFVGLAGVGDLITTCVSPQGRNRSVGERIGKGESLADVLASMNSVAEGVPTTQSVRQLARQHRVEMPITESVYAILFEGKDVKAALNDLMTREPKPEGER